MPYFIIIKNSAYTSTQHVLECLAHCSGSNSRRCKCHLVTGIRSSQEHRRLPQHLLLGLVFLAIAPSTVRRLRGRTTLLGDWPRFAWRMFCCSFYCCTVSQTHSDKNFCNDPNRRTGQKFFPPPFLSICKICWSNYSKFESQVLLSKSLWSATKTFIFLSLPENNFPIFLLALLLSIIVFQIGRRCSGSRGFAWCLMAHFVCCKYFSLFQGIWSFSSDDQWPHSCPLVSAT